MSKGAQALIRHKAAVDVAVACVLAVVAVAAVVVVQGNATTTEWRYSVTRLVFAGLTLVVAWQWAPGVVAESTGGVRRGLRLGGPVYPVMVLGLVAGFVSSGHFAGWASLAAFAFSMISVGIFEEVLFRGLLLGTISRAPIGRTALRAALVSSLIFGVVHLVNLPREGLGPTIAQIAYAALIGVFFAAVRIRSGSLIAVIVLHALLDGCFYLGSDVFDRAGAAQGPGIVASAVTVLIGLVLAAWGVRLLRRRSPREA